MTLRRVTDERVTTESKQELVIVPAGSPYEARLSEVPDQDHGVEIRRVSLATKTGTGTGSCASGGLYSGMSDRSYIVKIDGAGAIGVATFKWSNDDGDTWQGTLIPIPDTDPISLEFNLTVMFADGLAGTSFAIDDEYAFTAEYWLEVTYVPVQSKDFQIDYATGNVTFHSADASKTVQASYEGRGALVKADDINQLIDALESGASVLAGQDTSAFTANDCIGVDSSGAYVAGNATDDTKPALGFVKTVHATEGEIILFGPLLGFTGLTPNSIYYLDVTDGAITVTPPSAGGTVKQKVGRAMTATKLMVRISDEIVAN